MINKELKLKYIKSLKSGGKVPKYQTAWGTLDEKKIYDLIMQQYRQHLRSNINAVADYTAKELLGK